MPGSGSRTQSPSPQPLPHGAALATGTDHRLHIAMDLVSLQFLKVFVSDVHTGETLKHFTLAPGDVAVADRGYAHCQGMSAAVQQGADLIVRLNPFSVVLRDVVGGPLELVRRLETTAHGNAAYPGGRTLRDRRRA